MDIFYLNDAISDTKFPDEISLIINIAECPGDCSYCQLSHTHKNEGLIQLTNEVLDSLIKSCKNITCVGFIGGDQSPKDIVNFARHIRKEFPTLHIGWYSCKETFPLYHGVFDYIKLGKYVEENGLINDPSTNQRMLMNVGGSELNAAFIDITKKAFWQNL